MHRLYLVPDALQTEKRLPNITTGRQTTANMNHRWPLEGRRVLDNEAPKATPASNRTETPQWDLCGQNMMLEKYLQNRGKPCSKPKCKKLRTGTSRYCHEHRTEENRGKPCSTPKCEKLRTGASKYCHEHSTEKNRGKPCSEPNCAKLRKSSNRYCSQHISKASRSD